MLQSIGTFKIKVFLTHSLSRFQSVFIVCPRGHRMLIGCRSAVVQLHIVTELWEDVRELIKSLLLLLLLRLLGLTLLQSLLQDRDDSALQEVDDL